MTQSKILVLGAGRIGRLIAVDLAKHYQVTVADREPEALEKIKNKSNEISIIKADLSHSENIKDLVKPFELAVGAMPGSIGFQVLKAIIKAGKDAVDISFFPEDPFPLDELAKRNKVTAVVDCGLAPGMSNIILGRLNEEMQVSHYNCMVGGLPEKREWPFQYKAVFSPMDVIEEYVRPARVMEDGKLVIKEALSEPELVDFDQIGPLEAFNTDGLRTLLKTIPVPNMVEKTLRYPGTRKYLQVLKDCGFFSQQSVNINGKQIRPLDLTSKLLFPLWELKEGDKEFTVMRVTAAGKVAGNLRKVQYDLYDHYDPASGNTSMSRTTGFTATAVVNLILDKSFSQQGVIAPEYLGKEKQHFEFIMNYLKERGVEYQVSK